jgi:4-amino-4-deoxy-L-arabinose transferase-like glycosyltransferase
MSSKPPRLDAGLRREVLVVVVLTLVGAVLRVWSPARLGLVHFDEGIYALAGLWALAPGGLRDFDPTAIAYAPPGFSILEGLSYLGLGVGDFASILVSIAAGTLTIPAAAWVARRTFGSGAGAAAAAFTALSGAHVAFSRMALVDASFLLFWVVTIGQGQRFLERPNLARAVALGLAVGGAQLFKYNGWLSGAIVAASALLWLLTQREGGHSRWAIAAFGWGTAAALVAAAVYWPWYQFVDSHGGYAALLAHHRGYLGGLSSWPGHLHLQLTQAVALSGGPFWLACGGLAAAVGMSAAAGDFLVDYRFLPRIVAQVLCLALLCLWLLPNYAWMFVLVWTCFLFIPRERSATRAAIVLAAGWGLLLLLTPFYHPYARLWLPLEAFKWILLGGLFVAMRSACEVAGRGARAAWTHAGDRLPWLALVCVLGGLIQALAADWSARNTFPGVLGPSDSVRLACQSVLRDLPQGVKDLRVFVRPPVAFYLGLASHVAIVREPDVDQLLAEGDPNSWALLDLALVRQSPLAGGDLARLLADWTAVRDVPTTLNLPTLLDVDPSAASGRSIDASAALWLLRPKRPGDGA